MDRDLESIDMATGNLILVILIFSFITWGVCTVMGMM